MKVRFLHGARVLHNRLLRLFWVRKTVGSSPATLSLSSSVVQLARTQFCESCDVGSSPARSDNIMQDVAERLLR